LPGFTPLKTEGNGRRNGEARPKIKIVGEQGENQQFSAS